MEDCLFISAFFIMKIQKLLFVVSAIFCLLTGCTIANPTSENDVIRSTELISGPIPVTNPMKGYMAWGENYTDDPWVSYAYVPVCWNQVEPEEGKYDFASLENQWNFEKWGNRGVHVVLRVVADSPSDEAHMDIPQWLYDKTGGIPYDNDYGKGTMPYYESKAFQKYHNSLIKALAERYKDNDQVSFIQLGSLGHWGEWHQDEDGSFPKQETTDKYIEDYLEYFPAEKLLLRRPFQSGNENHLGLYNDSFGNPSSHEKWLSWIENGYYSVQSYEDLAGMPDFWKTAPSGGELATSYDDAWYFEEEQYETTKKLLLESHTTFIGPNRPKYDEFNDNANAIDFTSSMGYCFTIKKAEIKLYNNEEDILKLSMENTGIAPLYSDVDVYVEVRDSDGNAMWTEKHPLDMRTYIPGEFSITMPVTKADTDCQIYIGFGDPMMGYPNIHLANTNNEGFMYRLF